MGWLFMNGYSRKDMIEERIRDWETTSGETVVTTKCLAHCYRGGVFSGVLWTVWERTFAKDDKQVEPSQRWIGCDLLRSQRDYGWGFKDMEESMHPYFYSCPLKYLAIVPLDEYGGNAEWRELVHSWHSRQSEKRRSRRAAQSR